MTAPDSPALVLLVGAAGSGKSTYAAARWQPTQIVCLDALRAVVSDDECDQDATADAVTLLHTIVDSRLRRRLTTVIDATNTQPADRAPLLGIAARHHLPTVAIVFDTDLQVCLARQADRPGPAPGRRWGRAVPADIVRAQHTGVQAATPAALTAEGFAQVYAAGESWP